MKVVTDGTFSVAVIPECKATGIEDWARTNKLDIVQIGWDRIAPATNFYIPYRNTYDRIIRGIAADLHGSMIDHGIVNLNHVAWEEAKNVAIPYILEWIDGPGIIPMQQKDSNCHGGYYYAYLNNSIDYADAIFFNVEQIDKIPALLNIKYNLSLTLTIPDLPTGFYEHTVPYWVIDELYHTNKKLAIKIDNFIQQDNAFNKRYSISEL